MIRAIWKWFRTMNCRGLFASALTRQQQIKLPHICVPKAYTCLHFISSHLGYVVRKCYDFRTTMCCFTLCGFGKNSLWFIREQSPIWWDLQNEIGMHENLRVSTAESCQWRRVIALFFFVNCLHFERPLHRSRNTSTSTFIAQATSQSTKGPIILTSIEA